MLWLPTSRWVLAKKSCFGDIPDKAGETISIWGISITAVIFVLLHQVSYRLSPVLIVSGLLLWTAVGILYYWSKSLYLVVLFHGLMNTIMNTVGFEVGDISNLIVNALMLSLVGIFAFIRSWRDEPRQNSI